MMVVGWKRFAFLLALVLIALAPRLVFQAEWYRPGIWNLPVIDAAGYEASAREILQGRSQPAVYWQAPAYPAFISAVYGLLGREPARVGLVQACLGALTCLGVFLIARRLLPHRWSLLAFAFCVPYGTLLYFEGQLLRPTLSTFLLVAWLVLHFRITSAPGAWRYLVSGMLLGFAALCRENMLLLIPVVLAWEGVGARGRSGVTRWRHVGALALGSVLLIAPVTIRNVVVGDEFVLISSSGGINFFIGNNPESERSESIRPGRDWEELTSRPRRETSAMRPGERSAFFYREAFQYLMHEPGPAVTNSLRKTIAFLSAHEIPRNQDVYEGCAHSRLLSWLVWKRGGFGFPFGILAPLSILGALIVVTSGMRRDRESTFLVLLLVVYAIGVVAFFPAARYRLPLVPVMAVLAALACMRVVEWARERNARRLGVAAFVMMALVGLTSGGWVRASMDPAEKHFVRASALTNLDRPLRAIDELQKAVRVNPRHSEALTNLAALNGQRQRPGRAARLARTAIFVDSTYSKAWVNLGLAQIDLDSLDAAESSLRHGYLLQPDLDLAWQPLVRLLERADRAEEAIELAERGAERWPNDPTGWMRLGRISRRLERWETARAAFERASLLDPKSADARIALERMGPAEP